MEKYIEKRDSYYLQKLNKELLPEFPSFCKDFFVGIAMNTTALTRYNYAGDLKVFFEFLVFESGILPYDCIKSISVADLDTLTTSNFEQYLVYLDDYQGLDGTKRKNKDRAKARKMCAIRSLFRYLFNNDLLEKNVTTKVSMPKIRDKDIIRLEDEEVQGVICELESPTSFDSERQNSYNNKNTKIRDLAIINLMLGTGIRVSECVGLNISDIYFDNNSFKVTRKGEKESILYFNDGIKDILQKYLTVRKEQIAKINTDGNEDNDALFLSLQNKRICVRSVEMLVKKYAKLVTPLKHITPHKLRSTYGTALYRATKDIYVVAEVLGHKDINTTKKHYAAISEDIKKSAVNKVNFLTKDNSIDVPTNND